jgi:inorganic pyrophosphatase
MGSRHAALAPFDEKTGALNVVVETPKGRRNKFKFDERLELFTLTKVLPSGAVFPFDFGYVPATKGEDGDPLDVLLLMDEPVFVGCLVAARLVGVIEVEQT